VVNVPAVVAAPGELALAAVALAEAAPVALAVARRGPAPNLADREVVAVDWAASIVAGR
jgi:hypothetical protein